MSEENKKNSSVKFKGKKKVFMVVVAIALIGSLMVAATFGGSAKTEIITVMPDTNGIIHGDLDQRVTADGTVVAADEYSIFIELSQEVDKVYAEVGDYVEEGQLLVEYDIDDARKELQNKVTSAQISYNNAVITLEEMVKPAEGTELIDLQTQIVNAEKSLLEAENEYSKYDTKISQALKTLEDSKKDFENYSELIKLGAITQSELDSYETAYKNAQTAYDETVEGKQTLELNIESLKLAVDKAKLNLENGQNRLNDESIATSYKKQQNTVTTAKMELETAQNNLSKLTEATYSPISGTIIESNAVEGQMLTDSTVMMKVADLSNLDVTAYVSEYDIAKIEVGQKVELTSDGIEGVTYHGTVTKIEPVAESRNTISGSETTVPIVVHIDDNDSQVMPGFSFDMEIIVVDLSDIDYIPVSSVVKDRDTGETYVYTVNKDSIISKTVVELGTYSDMYVELKGGLDDNTVMLTNPDDTIEEGKSINDYATTKTVESGKSSSEGGSILDNITGGMQQGGNSGGNMQGRPGGGMPGGRP